MCGIFGYVGKKENTAQMVLDGLRLLEYRGYDSWGIAVKKDKHIVLEKHVGKIDQLSTRLPKSNLGIGHTRWATHGGVTVANAHPHLDCTREIALVHNGIVENYEFLKEKLIEEGHKFISETDTETVVHLIEQFIKEGNGFATSVRKSFNKLKGLNAIVVVYAPSKEIVAAKTGSPLVVGKDHSGLFIASDAAGIIKYTKDVLFLKDNEMVILNSSSLQLISLPKGKKINTTFEKVNWTIEDVKKGKFSHFMLKEIFEQPKVIRNIAEENGSQVSQLIKVINDAKGTFFIGAGTAFHACLAGVYLFSKVAKKHMNTAPASEFNYLEDFLTKDSLVIALSQSGETIDVIEPLNRAREKGSKIVGVVNALGSTIYRMADYKFLLNAGPEKAVASTKAYVAKLALLLLLSFSLVGREREIRLLLLKSVNVINELLRKKNLKKIKRLAVFLNESEHLYTIGRGISYATALEAALKIKEVSYLHTEGLAGGELKHGAIALISKGTPCLVFAPKDQTYQAILSNAMEIKARGGFLIGVSSENLSVFDEWIEVKDCGEASIIPQIVPAQLLGYFMALEKGLDPDKPRNLAKSVTVK